MPPERLLDALARTGPLVGGHYLDWAGLAERRPPPGLDHTLWWFAVRAARAAAGHNLPLFAGAGRAFTLSHPNPMLALLHQLDAGLSALAQPAPDSDGRLTAALAREAIASCQLEGIEFNRERARALLREGRAARDGAEQQVRNTFELLAQLPLLAASPLDEDRLKGWHAALTRETDEATTASPLRLDDATPPATDPDRERPPPPAAELPARLDRLCEFANADHSADTRPWLHPLQRASVLHFMVGHDRPFERANGRLARVVFYWSALRQGLRGIGFLSLSSGLVSDPRAHALSQRQSTRDGDCTYAVLHQLDTLSRALVDEHRSGEVRDAAAERLRSLADRTDTLNPRQIRLLNHALRHPGGHYTIRGHQGAHGVVYQTARTDLLDLAERGWLNRRKRSRQWVFEPAERLQTGH